MVEKNEKGNYISPCLKIPPQVCGSVKTCPDVSLYTSILNAFSDEWHLASTPVPWENTHA